MPAGQATVLANNARLDRPTILVVDDSLTFRNALGERLRTVGFDVILAASGQQALDSLKPMPDTIVVDLQMPGIDGIETCKRIRSAPEGADPPILLLTARDDLPARMQGRNAGATEFLVKGADFDAVVASVIDFVQRTTARQSSGTTNNEASLFDRVVAASGLARIIGETAIVRACRRAGIDPTTMTVTDLQRALPAIERSLSVFLPPSDRAARLAAVAAIAALGSGDRGDGAR